MRFRSAILVWLLAFCITFILLALVVGAPRLVKLSTGFEQVAGVVTSAPPRSHGMVTVRYHVGGADFERDFAPYNWPAGAEVTVFYRPTDPNVSALEDPRTILFRQLPASVGGAFLLASGVLLGTFFLLGAPRGLPRRSWNWTRGPRSTSAIILAGVAGSFAFSLLSGSADRLTVVAGVLMLSGCLLFLRCAWEPGSSWRQIVRGRRFWIAAVLAAAGSVLTSLSAGRPTGVGPN
jgi:hypothetical protein